MRILQVVASAERRGAEVFAYQLGLELQARGHMVSTVSLAPSDEPERLPFRSLINTNRRFASHSRFHPGVIKDLVQELKAHDITIAHGGSGLVPTAIASIFARRPFIYRNIGDPSFWGNVRFANLRIGLPLRRAAAVVSLYGAAGAYMTENYGVDRSRVTVLPNSVDADSFPRRSELDQLAAKERLGLSGTQLVMGYIGALSSEKRPEWAISASAAITDAMLLLAGDGPLRTQLEHAYGDSPGIRFLGSTSNPAGFLAGLDVLLIPSQTEGIPAVLIEAALVGVPVVATDVGGIQEVVQQTSCGIVVPADDESGFASAIGLVLSNPADYLADRASIVARHSMEQLGEQWEALLEETVRSG
ncbi:MAG: glycosyltransferase family 4 protein [Microthrixaceae bacterium]|nr:glycosyltransferase family 4 protein [Microthrixaceae bacterium]